MKKALIVANLAGFASFLLDDMAILQNMGYQVVYAANGDKLPWDQTQKDLEHNNVEFVQVDFDSKNPLAKQNISAFRQIRRILQCTRFDLIHCHTPIAGLLTRIAAVKQRRKGTRVLYTTHGFAFTDNSSFAQKVVYKTLEDIGSFLCDGIITINRKDFCSAQQLHCPKVHYIHGVGIDTKKFRNALDSRHEYRASIGVADEDILVMSVGELSARKNHRIIVEAISLLPDKERFVYAICGNGINGGTGELLRQLAEEKQVRLKLLGFRSDIPQLMACSDIGAIPSVREGLGLAGVESLAAGVPVVGAAVQGILDYVEDGKNGFLCDPFDAGSFARGIRCLAELNAEERAVMADNCIRIAQSFDKVISVQERASIYQQYQL